ncbi:MAG: hypothetical protein ABF747_01460 [Bifidobacterium sp.]|uniref:Uncharacterized protein n=1 Tax=Bifidobacterium fermentum TaxID=3059035 RepID=A0AB39UH17_9BIFI
MTSDKDAQMNGSAAYARFLPTSALSWVTMIVRAVFELGIALNLYGMLERIVHAIVWSSEEAASLSSYVTAISLIAIASYMAWRVFSLQWKRSDLFSICVGYTVASMPLVFLADALFSMNWVRLIAGALMLVMGTRIICRDDHDFASWFMDFSEPGSFERWAKRIVYLILKLAVSLVFVSILWKLVDGLQYVTRIEVWDWYFPALDTTSIQMFYRPIMMALIVMAVYFTVNSGGWYSNATVRAIIVTAIILAALIVVYSLSSSFLVYCFLNAIGIVLAVIVACIAFSLVIAMISGS